MLRLTEISPSRETDTATSVHQAAALDPDPAR